MVLGLSFIPEDRRQALADGRALPERAEGAALFADISGFTRLTEALVASWGQRQGAELLSQHLGRVYTALIGEVNAYRGSVIGFSGDAITCWFDQDDGRRAVAAALAMQRAMAPISSPPLSGGEVQRLAVKAAVVRGPVRRFVVGTRQRFDVLAGRTMDVLAAAEKLARPGDVVMAVGGLGGSLGEGAPEGVLVSSWLEDPVSNQRVAVVAGLHAPLKRAPWPDLDSAVAEPEVAAWLSAPVYARLAQGQGRFLASFRPAAALFLSFEGVDYDRDPQASEKLWAFIDWVEATVSRYEGSLIQLTTGDKGSYLYVAFGAPVLHQDDAARAVAAALELQQPPGALAFMQALRIGIAYGQMYAGTYGSDSRRTYGVLGSKTNLAARLMARSGPGGIVCDAETRDWARKTWAFEALPPVVVKGKDDAVSIYSPTGRLGAESGEFARQPLVGRAAQLAQVAALVGDLASGQGRVLRIEGEPGMGKTRLALELRALAQAAGMRVLEGAGQDIEAATPYRAWRDVLERHFGIFGMQDPREQLLAVRRALAQPERAWLPLLEDVLNLGLNDSPEIAALDPGARKDRLFDLLTGLFERDTASSRSVPLVVILEDAHWLDSLSWELALHLARTLAADTACLLVLVGRRLDEPTYADSAPELLRKLPHSSRLELPDLEPGDVAALIAQQLGVPAAQVPPEVIRVVAERASGNPFVVEELVRTLLGKNLLSVGAAGEEPRVRASSLSGARFLPDTLEGLILSRLDRLAPEQQTLLKVASVIGRAFASATLRDTVLKLEVLEEVRPYFLRELTRQGFIQPDFQVELTYLFRHLITYEAIYESLLFSQRHHVHRLVAQWYEATYATRLQDYTTLLAHHYGSACAGASDEAVVHKAVHYLEASIRQATLLGAMEEALAAGRRILSVLPATSRWAAKRAATLVRLGTLFEKTSSYDEATSYLEQGLEAATALGDPQTRIEAYCGLCMVGIRRGAYAAAQAMGERALEVAQQHADDLGAAQARASLGIIAAYQGDFGAAKAHFAAAADAYRQHDDLEQTGSLLNNLGIVFIYEKDYAGAATHLAAALAATQKLGHRSLAAKITANLGLVEEKQGRLKAAEAHYRQSLDIFREIGARQDAVINILSLGDVAAAQDETEAAWSSYLDAFLEAQAINALPTALLALRGLAAVLAETQPELAAQWLELALHHPASNSEIADHAAPVLARLGQQLSARDLRAARSRGKALELADVAAHARTLALG